VKIELVKIPLAGLTLVEELSPEALDLETEIVKFRGPVKAKAFISRISNAVTVELNITAPMRLECSRCLKELEVDFKREFRLNFSTDGMGRYLDLNPEIREEMIMEYPAKPLCGDNCQGLCARCGKNLNEGGCSCGST
jgi:uncharacterized protein